MSGARKLPVIGRSEDRRLAIPKRPPSFDRIHPLVDRERRETTYLRISVTDRCNLACVYCMPVTGEEDHALRPELMTFEEIVRVVGVFTSAGVRRVRLTGGEPLVRKDIVRLVAMVAAEESVDEVVMTTNAVRLSELATDLRDAGLRSVNVSLDTLEPVRFAEITRGGDLEAVLAGIDAALAAGIEVKINAVLLNGVNDEEAGALVDWAWSNGVVPRFIELMPIGEASKLSAEKFLSADEILARLGGRVNLGGRAEPEASKGPARYYTGARGRVGIISALSDNFCAGCNRVRVNARGELRACLADRRALSLRDLVRAGASDVELNWAMHVALFAKAAGHFFHQSSIDEHERVGMSLIGG